MKTGLKKTSYGKKLKKIPKISPLMNWLAHFQEMPNISAFGDTPQEALEELKIAWELVKEDYKEKNQQIPAISSVK